MQRRAIVALCMLSILLFPLTSLDANASSLDYTIQETMVSATLTLHFYQNATSIPNLNATLTGSVAQELTAALEASLTTRTTGISISALTGELTSSDNWINSTIRFGIEGAARRKGDLLVADCSWMSFNVSRDLKIENLSYNLIGATYLRPQFAAYANFTGAPLNETISAVQYLSGGEDAPAWIVTNRVGNATLLDFGRIGVPIENWRRTYNLTDDLTTWTYDPGPILDVGMGVTPLEGKPWNVQASYGYNASVSVRGSAQAKGNIISVDLFGGLQPLLMLVVVLVTFATAVITSWTYRSRRRQMLRRRR